VTLQRGVRKGNFLVQEPAVAISLEQQILTEIQGLRGEVQGTRGQIRDMRTVLMGSGEPTGETQYGRIPMLESDMREVKAEVATKASKEELQAVRSDVETLNDARVTGTAQWSVAKVAWAFVAALIIALAGGSCEALIAWMLLKRS
jgi:hypothetical protein